jgi:hypothetical protein
MTVKELKRMVNLLPEGLDELPVLDASRGEECRIALAVHWNYFVNPPELHSVEVEMTSEFE